MSPLAKSIRTVVFCVVLPLVANCPNPTAADSGHDGKALSVFVDNGTVHSAGWGTPHGPAGRKWRCALHLRVWRERICGRRILRRAQLAGMLLDEYDKDYWVNGAFAGEFASANSSEATVDSICVSGATVYAAGYYDNGSIRVPCYWTGTSRTDLSTR